MFFRGHDDSDPSKKRARFVNGSGGINCVEGSTATLPLMNDGRIDRSPRADTTRTVNPVSPSSDLVRRAQSGDQRAFTTLLRGCDQKMRSLASGLVGHGAATDDALQDAYLQAYRKLSTYTGQAAFSTWLHTIVYRTCLHHLRQRDKRAEIALDAVAEPSSAADHSDQQADADALDRALQGLPPDQAAAVLLVDGDGYSYDEAAAILGVAEGTIASRLNRGRHALRQTLHVHNAEGRHQ